MKVWTSGRIANPAGVRLLSDRRLGQAHAIPAFARKYGVKCYTCHTIPPALNKNGYMFKRLGYRMPPDEMDGTKPAPKITELDKDIKFSLQNRLCADPTGQLHRRQDRGRHGQHHLRISCLVLQLRRRRHPAELLLLQLQS